MYIKIWKGRKTINEIDFVPRSDKTWLRCFAIKRFAQVGFLWVELCKKLHQFRETNEIACAKQSWTYLNGLIFAQKFTNSTDVYLVVCSLDFSLMVPNYPHSSLVGKTFFEICFFFSFLLSHEVNFFLFLLIPINLSN